MVIIVKIEQEEFIGIQENANIRLELMKRIDFHETRMMGLTQDLDNLKLKSAQDNDVLMKKYKLNPKEQYSFEPRMNPDKLPEKEKKKT